MYIQLLLNFAFVTIPAGNFLMGSPEAEVDRYPDEGPRYEVTVGTEFEIQTTEVTQLQWVAVMGHNPSYFRTKNFCPENYAEINGVQVCADHPVENVTWNKIHDFINRLNDSQQDYIYRLPSEKEWEYAARAGTATAFSFGDDAALVGKYAWHEFNSGDQTHKVASLPANAFGLYDVHGNVWEWTEDLYKFYPGSDLPTWAPDTRRTLRGGSFMGWPRHVRSSMRYGQTPDQFYEFFGFRLVRTRK